ncbi:MAG TPA: hypothetical protein VFM17_07900 [Candidatus Eisenbacteria bacterium]|nr:hypothetical protein [Candidatus Eisenbacteria bacterium]
MRRFAFALASLLLAAALAFLSIDRWGGAFVRAALANLAVVAWSSFVLPLRGLPRFQRYYELRRWERSGRLYRALGVPIFRAIVRRGPLSIFNRALPKAWHSHDVERIEREVRAAEAAHGVAFGIILALAVVALVRGEVARAAWLAVLDLPLNLYPALLQRYHRLRLDEHLRRGEFVRPGESGPVDTPPKG